MDGLKFGWAHLFVATVIGFLLAYLFGWVPRPTKEADAGDWVAFSGNLFGAGLAVAGALYVEGRKRRSDRETDLGFLMEALEHLRAALAVAREPGADQLEDRQAEASRLLTRHEEARDLISFATSSARISRASVFVAMRKVTSILEFNQAMLDRETNYVTQAPTAQVLEIYEANIRAYADDALPILDSAIRTIRAAI